MGGNRYGDRDNFNDRGGPMNGDFESSGFGGDRDRDRGDRFNDRRGGFNRRDDDRGDRGDRRGPPRGGGGFRGGREMDEDKQRIMREGRCFVCKEQGHMAKDCPTRN